MGYWGWRPLVCGMFISSWVMGCTIVASTSSPDSTPSPYPLITLTEGRLPNPTAPPQPSRFSPVTATPAHQRDEHPALVVEPPTCYSQRDGSLICLGRVRNTLSQPVSAAELEVVLDGNDGEISADAVIEQMSIPPAAFAPYSVTFSADDLVGREMVFARLRNFAEEAIAGSLALDVSAISGALSSTGDRYIVAARVANPYGSAVWLDRAVVMLTDANDQVAGYRVQRLGELVAEPVASGGSTSIRVDVFLQTPVTNPTISIYVEGRSVENN